MRLLWALLVLSLISWMVKETCYGCNKSFTNISAHAAKCKKAHQFFQGGLRRRVDEHQASSQAREVKKQKKAEDKRAKAAEAKERLVVRRIQLEVEREASVAVTIEDLPPNRRQCRVPAKFADMLPTSLKGLPHLRLKPGLAASPNPRSQLAPPSVSTSGAPALRPRATVEDVPDDPMDDVHPVSPHARTPTPEPPSIDTPPNRFGVFRRYATAPRSDPEEGLSLDAFADASTHLRPPPDPRERNPFRPFGSTAHTWLSHAKGVASNSFAPFLNWSAFKIMEWQYSGSITKSASELQRLVGIITDDRFKKEDLVGFRVDDEQRKLDNFRVTGGAFSAADGWREGSVWLKLPKPRTAHDDDDEESAPGFLVKNIWHRSFIEVIKSAFQDASTQKFHWFPHRLLRKCATPEQPDAPPERLFTDIYNSDAMIRAHEEIQRLPPNPDDPADVERVVAAIGIYSDSTRLANFGTASLWPIYAFVLNLSKYLTLKPTMFAAHHLAYIPSLPAGVLASYTDIFNTPPSAAVIRFLKHELVHKVWLLLLDTEFMKAYEHGILILCGDGVWRRVFPRVFIYSADYPEKCLIACLKTLARRACPDCLIERCNFWRMGMKRDTVDRVKNARKDTSMLQGVITMVREWIFKNGTSPDGSNIKKTKLGLFSMTPTRLFVPDLMHEFELGVWKGTFTHLVRILIAAGRDGCQKLDERYSMISTFGHSVIRRFGDNVSAMKQLAARDFEQILKCSIPCFENLLPEPINSFVLTLLFELAQWHAFAKLQLHSESTIAALRDATSTLGQAVRAFRCHVCPRYATRELPRETQSRQRRKAAAAQAAAQNGAPTNEPVIALAPKFKAYTVPDTPKYHRLGDYARGMSETGTHDLKSTQGGEFEHRRAKQYYARTNKNFTFGLQIGLEVRRAALLHKISQSQTQLPQAREVQRKARKKKSRAVRGRRLQLRFEDSQPLPATQPDQHYHISSDSRYPIRLGDFLYENDGDPACENFECELRAHLLRRLPGGDTLLPGYVPTDDDLFRVCIEGKRLYQHKVLRINYTRYDMRRDQDSINPRTHPDIMMLAPDDATHSYLYARVIGLFHVVAYLAGDSLDGADDTEPEIIHVLWVRWFDLDTRAPGGFKVRRLPRLKWAALDDDGFGFLSPDQVLRAAHLMPAFAHGQSDATLPGYSIARREEEDDMDWKFHYVGIFVDRDMFMRYYGGAVGHQRGTPNKPQPPPVIAEPIAPLDGKGYNDEMDEEPEGDGIAALAAGAADLPEERNQPVDSGDEGSGSDSDSDSEEDDLDEGGENSDDDGALGPEDGEVGMGEDEFELARAGFASM